MLCVLWLASCGDETSPVIVGSGGDAGTCVAGNEHCECYPNDTCNGALECSNDSCVNPGAGGGGNCEVGEAGCTCGPAGTCAPGLSCQSDICAVTGAAGGGGCETGDPGCACFAGSTCSEGLVCLNGVCAFDPGGTGGSGGGPGGSGGAGNGGAGGIPSGGTGAAPSGGTGAAPSGGTGAAPSGGTGGGGTGGSGASGGCDPGGPPLGTGGMFSSYGPNLIGNGTFCTDDGWMTMPATTGTLTTDVSSGAMCLSYSGNDRANSTLWYEPIISLPATSYYTITFLSWQTLTTLPSGFAIGAINAATSYLYPTTCSRERRPPTSPTVYECLFVSDGVVDVRLTFQFDHAAAQTPETMCFDEITVRRAM